VQPGIYEINNPKPDDPLLVTTNFSITYFSVANEVEGSGLPAWLLVTDAEGMSVLTAWAAGKFDAERIAKAVKEFKVVDKISSKQIEAARIAMTRHVKRGGKLWIRIFPDKPFTKKPAEVRMGKGKGSPEGWVAVIRPGRVLYEMEGVPRELAKEALRLASHKLSVKTRFIERGVL